MQAEEMRKEREFLGLSQEGLASLSGTTLSTLCSWEQGRYLGRDITPKLNRGLSIAEVELGANDILTIDEIENTRKLLGLTVFRFTANMGVSDSHYRKAKRHRRIVTRRFLRRTTLAIRGKYGDKLIELGWTKGMNGSKEKEITGMAEQAQQDVTVVGIVKGNEPDSASNQPITTQGKTMEFLDAKMDNNMPAIESELESNRAELKDIDKAIDDICSANDKAAAKITEMEEALSQNGHRFTAMFIKEKREQYRQIEDMKKERDIDSAPLQGLREVREKVLGRIATFERRKQKLERKIAGEVITESKAIINRQMAELQLLNDKLTAVSDWANQD